MTFNPFRGRFWYRIHYYQNGKLIAQRGRWTYLDAGSFLKRMGYHETKYGYVKGNRSAKIIGSNGIPF